MDIEDARRIFRGLELPRGGFEELLSELGNVELAGTAGRQTRSSRRTAPDAKVDGSRAA